MKIVAGKYGGRKLIVPKGRGVRPTTDKVRGAVFNMLISRKAVEGANVLDAFCGSGALGIEAISRGADYCYFIDKSRSSLDIARENVIALGAEGYCNFVIRDSVKLQEKPGDRQNYNLVFLDPPYNRGLIPKVLERLINGNWLEFGAWIICESERSFDLPETLGILVDSKKIYGDIKITLAQYIS